MLKLKVESLDEVPEALREAYKEAADGSGFVLDTEPLKDPRLDEFRTNNRTLHSEVEKLKAKLQSFDGVDLEDIQRTKAALDKVKEEEERRLLKEGKWDEVVSRRTAVAIKEAEGRIKAAQDTLAAREQENKKLKSRLADLSIDSAVTKAIEKAGVKVRPGAMSDVLRRARETWRIGDDGKMQPVDPEGQTRYGKGGDVLSVDEFVTSDLVEQAGHLFEGASGGGAGGGRPGVGGGKRVLTTTDPHELGKNLEDIAAGKVDVLLGES